MITFLNNSGQEIEVNENPLNIQAAENAGWVNKAKAEAEAAEAQDLLSEPAKEEKKPTAKKGK